MPDDIHRPEEPWAMPPKNGDLEKRVHDLELEMAARRAWSQEKVKEIESTRLRHESEALERARNNDDAHEAICLELKEVNRSVARLFTATEKTRTRVTMAVMGAGTLVALSIAIAKLMTEGK